jgi:hypothetical protein
MREKGDPSNSVLPPVDPLGRNFKSNTKSKGDVEREKRQRKMRKTLEPGSVKFDVGLTVESLKDSGKKREERQTIAREKREAMLEAQRAAVLDSIDSKEEKRKAFQKRKEMEVLQRKVRTEGTRSDVKEPLRESSVGESSIPKAKQHLRDDNFQRARFSSTNPLPPTP